MLGLPAPRQAIAIAIVALLVVFALYWWHTGQNVLTRATPAAA